MSSAARDRWAVLAGIVLLAGCRTTAGDAPTASADAAAPSVEARLTGIVSYRERMALPADATVEVRLEDVSRADAPATLIAEQRIEVEGRQVPIPFELRYPPDRIEANRRYALRAEIRAADGTLMFTTDTRHAALAEGGPTEGIEIRVQRAAAPQVANEALIGDWRLTAIQKAGAPEVIVSDEVPYTMTFGSDGRVTGKAHCNSYGGAYDVPGDGELRMTGVAATLMACMSPSLADVFLGSLGAVNQYAVLGTELRLTTTGGDTLKLARPSATANAPPTTATSAPPTPEPNAPPSLSKPWVDAAQRGVGFRALGNEPSWVIEITDRQATIITELGERRTEFKLAEPVVKGDTTIWRSAGGGEGLVAVLQRSQCVDGMSGEQMEATAAVTFEGTTYKGCGRFLR